MGNFKNVQVVSLEQPCTACIITTNLVIEMLTKQYAKAKNFQLEIIKLSHIKQITEIKGIEVEKLPLILVDGEQITAGNFPKRELLNHYLPIDG